MPLVLPKFANLVYMVLNSELELRVYSMHCASKQGLSSYNISIVMKESRSFQ